MQMQKNTQMHSEESFRRISFFLHCTRGGRYKGEDCQEVLSVLQLQKCNPLPCLKSIDCVTISVLDTQDSETGSTKEEVKI